MTLRRQPCNDGDQVYTNNSISQLDLRVETSTLDRRCAYRPIFTTSFTGTGSVIFIISYYVTDCEQNKIVCSFIKFCWCHLHYSTLLPEYRILYCSWRNEYFHDYFQHNMNSDILALSYIYSWPQMVRKFLSMFYTYKSIPEVTTLRFNREFLYFALYMCWCVCVCLYVFFYSFLCPFTCLLWA